MNDDRLRAILPFLRPRIEEPSPLVWTLFFLLCAGLAAVIIVHIHGQRKARRLRQNALSKLAEQKGLEQADIDLLQSLTSALERPVQLVESAYAYNRTVDPYVAELMQRDQHHPHLDHLATVRQRLGFDRVEPGRSVRSSHELPAGITLMVWLEDETHGAFYPWILVEQNERAWAIVPLLKEDYFRYPHLSSEPALTLRFWIGDDTEYRAVVPIQSIDAAQHAVYLEHTIQLERLQQRDFYRISVHFPLRFVVLSSGQDDPEPMEGSDAKTETTAPFIDVHVLDLSAGGLSVETEEDAAYDGERFAVDDGFRGAFSLAGLVCEVVHREQIEKALRLQLRFEPMSEARRSQLVRQVYDYQLRSTLDDSASS